MIKIIKDTKLNEDFLTEVYFTDERNLDYHYNKHVISDEDKNWKMKYMSKEEYNKLADWLSSVKNIGDATDREYRGRFVGYISNNGIIVVRDNISNLVVVFVDDVVHGHSAIALYKQSLNKFLRKMNDPTGNYKYVSNIENFLNP